MLPLVKHRAAGHHVGAHAAQRSQSPSSAGPMPPSRSRCSSSPWCGSRHEAPAAQAIARGWWAAAVAAAMAWWFIPLALQSRAGTDFFPISEQADATTQFTAPFQVLRGAADWVGHLRFFGEPHLVPAWVVAHSELVIVARACCSSRRRRCSPRERSHKHGSSASRCSSASRSCRARHDGGVLGNPLSDRCSISCPTGR